MEVVVVVTLVICHQLCVYYDQRRLLLLLRAAGHTNNNHNNNKPARASAKTAPVSVSQPITGKLILTNDQLVGGAKFVFLRLEQSHRALQCVCLVCVCACVSTEALGVVESALICRVILHN